jgi:DNA-binding MarR family transcriptional regulator
MAARSVRKPDAAPTVADAHAAIACVTRLTELTQQRRVQLATAVGLTDHQWGVLEEIATEHFMPSLFARRRDSSAAAVSKILRQLSDKGLVVAEIAAEDSRQRRYSLTTEGRRVMARLRASREAAIRDIWLTLDAAGLRAFTQVGHIIIARLERYAATVISNQE